MAAAAAQLVAVERAYLQITANGADKPALAAKQVRWAGLGWRGGCAGGQSHLRSLFPQLPAHPLTAPLFARSIGPPSPQAERAEAASLLERRLAAIEALLTARRQVAAAAVVEEAEPALPSFMQPPPSVVSKESEERASRCCSRLRLPAAAAAPGSSTSTA